MKFEKVIEQRKEITANVKEITLLTTEEAKALPKDIRRMGRGWWLRSPGYGTDKLVAYVDGNGNVVDYGYLVCRKGLYIRPALSLESSELKTGDQFDYAEEHWIMITDNMAICNTLIRKSWFRLSPTVRPLQVR